MQRSYGRRTPQANAYLAEASRRLARLSPAEIARRTVEIVDEHDAWRQHAAISLNAAENVLSAQCRALLDSDLATRVTEGFPGDKDFPAHRQNRFTDELEASIIYMAGKLFDARHVEWRPVSTSMANATVFFAMTRPGDTILAQPEAAGGNYSYNPDGPPRAARLDVQPLPFDDESFEIRVDAAISAIRAAEPKLIVVGGSNVLFPYPIRELRSVADQVGARIVYDAAHTALYLPFGLFQDPLREGADILTFSNHKLLSGPVGGFILTNDDAIADQIMEYSFPTLVQTRDQNKYAASAHGLAEMLEHGENYAKATLANAQSLALALEEEGFGILCADRGYTRTHQLFALVSDEDGDVFEDLCQDANLLVSRAQRMGKSNRVAVRLTTQEITRRGMRSEHMRVIASWLRRVIRDREDPERIAAEIREFLVQFPTLHFSFDDSSPV